jgi:hypothetical protein
VRKSQEERVSLRCCARIDCHSQGGRLIWRGFSPIVRLLQHSKYVVHDQQKSFISEAGIAVELRDRIQAVEEQTKSYEGSDCEAVWKQTVQF